MTLTDTLLSEIDGKVMVTANIRGKKLSIKYDRVNEKDVIRYLKKNYRYMTTDYRVPDFLRNLYYRNRDRGQSLIETVDFTRWSLQRLSEFWAAIVYYRISPEERERREKILRKL